MTFGDLEQCVHEDIMMENEDPTAIAAEVSKLLNGLSHQDIFVVHRLVKDIASAIAYVRIQGPRHGRGRQDARRHIGDDDRLAPAPWYQLPFIAAGDADQHQRMTLERREPSRKLP
jgi:hypothetical protein